MLKPHLYIVLVHMCYHAFSIPEEYYQTEIKDGQSEIDEDTPMYGYVDVRSRVLQEKPGAIRRSILDKNFARLGRGDESVILPGPGYSDYVDMDELTYARPTRSGNPDKIDHFVRFGRTRPQQQLMSRPPRNKDNFMRFGRSHHNRQKRSSVGEPERETFASFLKRKSDGGGGKSSSFVRFGRNDNFMRFGRNNNNNNVVHSNNSRPLAATSSTAADFYESKLDRSLWQLLRQLSLMRSSNTHND